MTVEKHTYHRIYELFSVNEPIADWIAMTDFDTPYPLMLTLMEAKEDEEREAPLEAVIWAAAEIAAAANLRDGGGRQKFNLRLVMQPLDKARLRAEIRAAVNQPHMRTDARKIERILQRGVATADDRYIPPAEERAVTNRAIGDAAVRKAFLARYAEVTAHRARGDP